MPDAARHCAHWRPSMWFMEKGADSWPRPGIAGASSTTLIGPRCHCATASIRQHSYNNVLSRLSDYASYVLCNHHSLQGFLFARLDWCLQSLRPYHFMPQEKMPLSLTHHTARFCKRKRYSSKKASLAQPLGSEHVRCGSWWRHQPQSAMGTWRDPLSSRRQPIQLSAL